MKNRILTLILCIESVQTTMSTVKIQTLVGFFNGCVTPAPDQSTTPQILYQLLTDPSERS